MLGFYGAASAAFVVSRIRRSNLNVFEIPVFITGIFFLQFGLAPLRNFIDPTQIDPHLSGDGRELVRALSYCILGMMAFWAGSEFARRKDPGRVLRDAGGQSILTESREAQVTLLPFVALYLVSFCTKYFLLRSSLFSYTASEEKYWANVAAMQVLNFISQIGTLALIGVAIERYRKPQDMIWRNLFLLIFISELLWGLISGMKGAVLLNFMAVALVSSLVKRRLNMLWLVSPLLALIFLYPFSNAYRAVVRGGQEVTSFQAAVRAAEMAGSRMLERMPTVQDIMSEGAISSLQRLDLLTSVADVLALGPRASFVKGNAPWLMLPFYPFIPRLIWPSKPVLVEGGRFTVALYGNTGDAARAGSSTAVTYAGDLYLQFGLLGVPLGMFALGLVAQWLSNGLSGPLQRRDLFVYGGVLLLGFPLEGDTFSLWTGLIKLLAILYVLSWVAYGSRSRPRRPLPSPSVPGGVESESSS